MAYSTSDTEIRHLVKSWVFISLAFGIVLGGLSNIMTTFILAGLTVGVGFIFHELGHKIVAQYYGCKAEFRASDQMLWFALISSFFGIVFAAPGAVMIQNRHLSTKKMGHIALAGPLVNYVGALLFLGLLMVSTTPFLQTLGRYGFLINAWLGIFNMLPFWVLDGKKVWAWNRTVFAVSIIIGVVIMQFGTIFT